MLVPCRAMSSTCFPIRARLSHERSAMPEDGRAMRSQDRSGPREGQSDSGILESSQDKRGWRSGTEGQLARTIPMDKPL